MEDNLSTRQFKSEADVKGITPKDPGPRDLNDPTWVARDRDYKALTGKQPEFAHGSGSFGVNTD
jgi:hypothetical protein